jgi:hypothetical protein
MHLQGVQQQQDQKYRRRGAPEPAVEAVLESARDHSIPDKN